MYISPMYISPMYILSPMKDIGENKLKNSNFHFAFSPKLFFYTITLH